MAAADAQENAGREVPAPVCVAYSPAPGRMTLLSLPWLAGLQVAVAVQRSGLLALHPEIDLTAAALGVWGRRVQALDPVRPGDRIEIYRALTVDPKEARRLRYRAQGPKPKPLHPRRPRPEGAERRFDSKAPKARTPLK